MNDNMENTSGRQDSGDLVLQVKWHSGTERLDLAKIARALESDASSGASISSVRTVELRIANTCAVQYDAIVSHSNLSPDAFTLTYETPGIWMTGSEEGTEAESDFGTATYQKTIQSDGAERWTCFWKSNDKPAVEHSPICTLSDAENTRLYRMFARAERDYKFRKLILGKQPRCEITGETKQVVLDAAHIFPVADGGKDEFENGIVLRRDLHKLFDANIIKLSTDGIFTMNPILNSYKELFDVPHKLSNNKTIAFEKNINARNMAAKGNKV
jgi:hypothetical protein